MRLAIACYLGRVAIDIVPFDDSKKLSTIKIARWLWTIGCLLYLSHVICAFEFFHEWDHGRAFAHTAAQTESLIGIRWGGGLYFNYAFTLFWLADSVVWWGSDANAHYRSRGYLWTLHGVFAFMVFNATVVFGPPVWRYVAVLVGVALTFVYFVSRCVRPRGR